MNQFQKTVLTIAIGVLLFILFIIAILIRKSAKKVNFPPETAKCPDYWTLNQNGECIKPDEIMTSCGNMNFDTDEYRGKVAKCNWAKNECNPMVEWDGISNIGIC